MGVLSRAIFREIAGASVLGTVLFTFVLFLQKLGGGKLFEVLVRGSASGSSVLYLFALAVPPTLIFALPVGTLVGVLIGLGRMSSDGEIIAMRATGVPSRKVVLPVLALSALSTIAAACCSLWLTPWAVRETYRVINGAKAQQLTAEIRPRIFEKQFTDSNSVLYIGDRKPSANSTVEWRNVFIADLSPPRPDGAPTGDEATPRITVAAQAIAAPDPVRNTIQLSMSGGVSTYEVGKRDQAGKTEPTILYTFAPRQDQLLAAHAPSDETPKAHLAMDTRPLMEKGAGSVEGRIEMHRRFALPLACMLLAVAGIPLGASSRKSGKSAAFVLTVAMAFFYWMSLISLIGMAEQGKLQAWQAVWAPNVVFGIAGIVLMAGLERAGDRDALSRIKSAGAGMWSRLRTLVGKSALAGSPIGRLRLPLLPGLIDTYVLGVFFFYLAVLLTSLVLLAHVFIFFDYLSDVITHKIPLRRDLTYHIFLTPKLIYDSAPMSVLVAVLVTFGALSKSNEVTAMKACGVSLYRLAAPVLISSLLLSGSLFAFDHYYIPEANQIQEGILNEIKGRPSQTYLRAGQNWIFGEGSRIFYYKYFDPEDAVMIGVHVYELDAATFRLNKYIYAESAEWLPMRKTWRFQNGWAHELEFMPKGNVPIKHRTSVFEAATFPELTEQPSYFLKEVKQESQLNFVELGKYIQDLQQSGYDTVKFQVQLHKKFSVPLFVLIMALLSVPFSFVAGSRGAMTGVGVSFGIAISYWAVSKLFEEVGNVSLLKPVLAAWAPDAVFTLAGLYLFTRLRT